jgi:fumarate hydratase class II
MNANEVISNRAIEIAGGEMGSKSLPSIRTTT